MAAMGAPYGTVVIADSQTGGRGRLGRTFYSPAGNGVYLSVVLRPNLRPQQLMHLTCATAVAACNAVEIAVGIHPGIKWTNDLVVNCKKLGGILTELSIKADGFVDYIIIGIGINCGQKAEDFPPEIANIATSLSLYAGQSVDRGRLAAAIIDSVAHMAEVLENADAFLPQYRADCITLGQDISLLRGDEVRHGKALDVDKNGALIVQFADGRLETVTSGEVSVRGMYGYV